MVALARQSAKNPRERLIPVGGFPDTSGTELQGLATRRRNHRLTTDQLQALIIARRDGAEINDLVNRFAIHRTTVLNHLRRAGVDPRPWPGRTLTSDQLQQAGQLYESGLSLAAVGERLGVDKRYLRRALSGSGIAIRDPGRQPRH